MKILDLISVIKSGVPGVSIYPNKLPISVDDCASVAMTGGSAPDDMIPVSRPTVQVIVRAKDEATAESNITTIFSFLNRKQFFEVGTVKVIQCTALNSGPIFLGTDENDRTLYSANFIFVTKE